MAAYHLARLRAEVAQFRPPADVSIPLQAHFEGVVYCADAATDQLLEYLIHRCRLDDHANLRGTGRTLTNALSVLGGATDCPIDTPSIVALERWNAKPIVGDARRVRNLAAHEYHIKSAHLEVERVPGSQYHGSRILDAYCAEVLAHWEQLPPLLVQLRC
jgi:hypothetical protein